MITVDIAADLNGEDETGVVWTYLDDARDPALIQPGSVVIAGDADASVVCEVVDLVAEPSGTIVHLRLYPARSRTTRRWCGERVFPLNLPVPE
jgi:hypothetical protein